MVELKGVFKQYLEPAKNVVEEKLEVSLGKLRVLPCWSFGLFEYEYENDFSKLENLDFYLQEIKGYFLQDMKKPTLLARAGNRGVYYSRLKHKHPLTEFEAKQTLYHELFHIGLARYAFYENIFDDEFMDMVPTDIDEQFAEYMSLKAMEKEGHNIDKLLLESKIQWFVDKVQDNKLTKPKDIAHFTLFYHQKQEQEGKNLNN